jgi:hypothetical protein
VWSTASGLSSLIANRIVTPFATENSAALPAEFRDPEGYWAATNMIVLGLAANTTLVAANERPRSYDDLLQPTWRGKLVWKPNDITGAWGFIGNILTSMGEEKGLAYLRRLSAQNIAPVGAATRAILDQVAVGEYSLILGVSNHNAEFARKTGAPVAWLPLDSAWATLHTIGVTNAAASKCGPTVRRFRAVEGRSGDFPQRRLPAGAARCASRDALAALARGRLPGDRVRAGRHRPQHRALERGLQRDFSLAGAGALGCAPGGPLAE